jgi:hypothetical protein
VSRTADVQSSIWADAEFRHLSPRGKLLYLWALTTPHGNNAGVFKASHDVIASETGMTDTQVNAGRDELAEVRFLITEGSWLWIVGMAKHIRNQSPNMGKSIANVVRRLDRRHPLRVAFLHEYRDSWLSQYLTPLLVEDAGRPSSDVAAAVLTNLVSERPRPVCEVLEAAREAGVSDTDLYRAKDSLEVRAVNLCGEWHWTTDPDALDNFGSTGHILKPLKGLKPLEPLQGLEGLKGKGTGTGSSSVEGTTSQGSNADGNASVTALSSKLNVSQGRSRSEIVREQNRLEEQRRQERFEKYERMVAEWFPHLAGDDARDCRNLLMNATPPERRGPWVATAEWALGVVGDAHPEWIKEDGRAA